MNYVQLAIPFFIGALLVEFLFGALFRRQTYRLSDTVNSLQLGMLSQLVGVLRLSFSAIVIGWSASSMGIVAWSPDHWVYWVLSFIAYDFCYYWKHRFGHEWRIMWASHVAHHQSQDYNLSTALRQTSTDYVGFLFYLPLYLLGMPAEVVITVGSLNLVYQFWVHTEHVRTLGAIDYIFVTPANHRVHHAINDGYLDKNYGGVFVIWDRLFGTFVMEDQENPCSYGIRHPLDSWNPVWANFHVWMDTLRLSFRGATVKEKFLIWFRSPAWIGSGSTIVNSQDRCRSEKYDSSASVFDKAYTFVQFWITTGAALMLQALETSLPRSLVLTMFFVLLVSVLIQGLWLEGRRHMYLFEWVRLAVLALFSFLAVRVWPSLTFEFESLDVLMLVQTFCGFCAGILIIHHLRMLKSERPFGVQ
ncbi:sterol desaturase family protein [Gammaproteobacteria bacterium]|nr:sterol desaturase family protein [Gammaproteobacteria bacterium]